MRRTCGFRSTIQAAQPSSLDFTYDAASARETDVWSPLRRSFIATSPRARSSSPRIATNGTLRADPYLNCLPILSAYLGHVHVADTQWYLSGSPELMREAMHRLEHLWEERS